jgi:hypothetical protein
MHELLVAEVLDDVDDCRESRRFAASRVPLWAEGLVLSGIHAYGRLWTASVQDGAVAVATSR